MTPVSAIAELTDEDLINHPERYTKTMGGRDFYGCSPAFHRMFSMLEEFIRGIGDASSEGDPGPVRAPAESKSVKRAILLSNGLDTRTLGKAANTEATSADKTITLLIGDGTQAINWQSALSQTLRHVLISGLPGKIEARGKVYEKLRQFPGRVLLLAQAEFSADEGMTSFVDRFVLPSIDTLPQDKLARLIGLIVEQYRRVTDCTPTEARISLRRLPLASLRVFCDKAPWEDRLGDLEKLGDEVADAMELAGPDGAVSEAAFWQICFDWLAEPRQGRRFTGRRIFVEGETDKQLLELAARLFADGFDYLEGLKIEPLGEGRDGGTSQIGPILAKYQPARERDIFLLDNDPPGRKANQQLNAFGQNAVLLLERFSRKGGHSEPDQQEIEIEDLLTLDCLDRFYEAHSELRPEAEALHYKGNERRRLVVNGADKNKLVTWLEGHAIGTDLERVFYMLCHLRLLLGLGVRRTSREMEAWSARLLQANHPSSQAGRRPRPWWYVSPPPEQVPGEASIPVPAAPAPAPPCDAPFTLPRILLKDA